MLMQVLVVLGAMQLQTREARHAMDKLGMFTALRAEHAMMKVRNSMRQALQGISDLRNLPEQGPEGVFQGKQNTKLVTLQ